jgi:hypothetical protein
MKVWPKGGGYKGFCNNLTIKNIIVCKNVSCDVGLKEANCLFKVLFKIQAILDILSFAIHSFNYFRTQKTMKIMNNEGKTHNVAYFMPKLAVYTVYQGLWPS